MKARALAVLPIVLALPLAGTAPTPRVATTPVPFHPHFAKKVEVQLPRDLTLTVTHITVPFNEERAAAVEPGGGWHMGNAHLEVTADVQIGGVDVEKGRYSLKTRQNDDGEWHLVLDRPSRFDRNISDDAKELETDYVDDAKAGAWEHLSIDVQPSGDKKSTTLYLDVRFDKKLARCEIVLPEGGRRERR